MSQESRAKPKPQFLTYGSVRRADFSNCAQCSKVLIYQNPFNEKRSESIRQIIKILSSNYCGVIVWAGKVDLWEVSIFVNEIGGRMVL
jgi:hypothetical protein